MSYFREKIFANRKFTYRLDFFGGWGDIVAPYHDATVYDLYSVSLTCFTMSTAETDFRCIVLSFCYVIYSTQ